MQYHGLHFKALAHLRQGEMEQKIGKEPTKINKKPLTK